MPKVSIIIPCYNQEKFLQQALEGLQRQSLTDYECIIVDDGSTDSSAMVAQRFSEQDRRFRLVKKSNGGTASARNAGLREATGEYIQFLDADDDLHPKKLEMQTRKMEQEHWDFSYTEYLHFREQNGQRTLVSHIGFTTRVTGSLLLTLLVRYGVDFSVPPIAFLYKRDFLRKHALQFTEEIRYREDWDFILNIARLSSLHWGCIRDYTGAYYRQNPQGKTCSAEKLSSGNIMYICYKAKYLSTKLLPLWAFRLSCELMLTAGRSVKHTSLVALKPIALLWHDISIQSICITILSIILLPISLLYIVLRSVFVYADRMRQTNINTNTTQA